MEERRFTYDEIIFNLTKKIIKDPQECSVLNVEKIKTLFEQTPLPEDQLIDLYYAMAEDVGERNGDHQENIYVGHLSRHVKYGRLVFFKEVRRVTEVEVTENGENKVKCALGVERAKIIRKLARLRGITPNMAFRWHREHMGYLSGPFESMESIIHHQNATTMVEKVCDTYIPDSDYYFLLQDLRDLEAVMFMDEFYPEPED